jgi:hypothetical protein
VVLNFSVDEENGKAFAPSIAVDAHRSVNPSIPLVATALEYLEDTRFDSRFHSRTRNRKLLTAAFIFEFEPCGAADDSVPYDYVIDLCRVRPPPPNIRIY